MSSCRCLVRWRMCCVCSGCSRRSCVACCRVCLLCPCNARSRFEVRASKPARCGGRKVRRTTALLAIAEMLATAAATATTQAAGARFLQQSHPIEPTISSSPSLRLLNHIRPPSCQPERPTSPASTHESSRPQQDSRPMIHGRESTRQHSTSSASCNA